MQISAFAQGAARLAITLALAAAFSSDCLAQTLTWTGAGDGTTFGMASNWSPVAAPTAASNCVIPSGATPVLITNNHAVRSLTTARKVIVDSCCTFTLTAGLHLQGGAIVQLANTGSCNGLIFFGGTQSISGDGEIAVLNMGINGSGILLTSNASVTLSTGVRMTFNASATGPYCGIEVPPGCTFTNQGEISLSKNNATLSILNQGTFINQGTVSVSAGTLKVSTGTWTNSGTFSVSGTGTLSLAGQFSSLGSVSRTGGTIIVGGRFTGPELTATATTGEIVLTNADFTGVTLRGDGAAVRGSGSSSLRNCAIRGEVKHTFGAWTIREGLELRDNATLALPSSGSPRLIFVGGVQDVWGSGTLSSPNLSVDPNTSVTIAAGVQIACGTGGVSPTRGDGEFFVDTGGTLKTLGPINLLGPYSIFSVTGTGVYTNAGAITAGDTNSVRLQSDDWVNAGTISGNGASLTFAGRFAALGSVTRVGGTITLSGTCVGPEVRATAGTGDISLDDLEAIGVLFAADGANAFTINDEVSLTGCTLAASTTIRGCSSDLIVRSGLAFSGGATLLLSAECSNDAVTFDGGTQLVSGSGTIQRGTGRDPDITIKNNATVTLGTGIVTRVRSIVIESGSQLINSGEIVSDVSGASLTISGAGAFTNSGMLSAAGAGVTLSVAAWTNNGVFAVSGSSFLSLQGTYASLGTIQRTGGTIELKGTFTGTALAATPATGDLQLANVTLTGVALSSSGSAKLVQKFGVAILDACSITGEMIISQDGQWTIRNGLTLVDGATITLDAPVANDYAAVYLVGAPQTVGGTGTFQFGSTTGSSGITIQAGASATFETGIVVRNRAGATGSGVPHIVSSENSVLTMRGQVLSDVVGRSMQITGSFGGKFVNEGLLVADGGALEVSPPLWTNSGSFLLQNSGTLTLGGTYSAIGAITRTGGTFILGGTPTSGQITTDDAAGDIVLGTLTATSSTLRGIGTRRIIARGTATLDGCTLGGTSIIESCATVNIKNGLTLDSAAVSFSATSNCNQSNLNLYFWGGPQTFGGTGTVQLGGASIRTEDIVTFGSGIAFSIGAPGSMSGASIAVGATIDCYSPIVMNSPNATLNITGGSSSRFLNLGGIDLIAGTLNLTCLWGSAGDLSMAPGSKLYLGGTYSIDSPLAASNGGLLSLSGNWVNNSQVSSNGATLYLAGTWTNAGFLDVSNSKWQIGGVYPSLGAHTASNNVLTYAGSFPGDTLIADASTGDITLSNLSANGVTFRGQDGKKFVMNASSTWIGCTLDADMLVGGCTTLNVFGGLTLQHGSTITVDLTCNTTGVRVSANDDLHIGLLGEGRVRILNNGSTGKGISFEGANQDIPVGIVIETPAEATAVATSVVSTSTITITNRGTISMGRSGGTFAWTGGKLVNEGLLHITAGKLDISSFSGPSGNVQLDPGASLSLNGVFTVDHNLSALAGGELSLNGTWSNTAAISSLNSKLILGGTWSNAGTFSVSNSAWTIGGVYPSLGNWSGGSNALTYAGTYPGNSLIANASTGDITLSTVTFTNALLSATDGARFLFTPRAAVTLNSCDLAADLLVGPCASLVIAGPLNLLDSPTIRLANESCTSTALSFANAHSSISGLGKILIGVNNATTVISLSSASATLGPDVFVGFDPAQSTTRNATIFIGSSLTLTVHGVLSADQPDRTLTVSGSGTFTNAGTVRCTADTLSISPFAISNLPTSTSTLTGGKWIAAGGSLTLGGRTIWSIAPNTELALTGPGISTPNLSGLRSNSGKLSIENLSIATTPSTGTFSNSGELGLRPGGTLSVTGSASLLPGSMLNVPVRGSGPTQKGAITATASIALGGRLTGSFESPYQPVQDDVIPGVLVAPAITGAFDSVCFADNPSRLGVIAQLDSGTAPMSLNLIVTSEAGLSPKFSQQPADSTASPIAHFQAQAGPSGVTYLWLKDSVPLTDGPTADGSVVSGATSPSLTITNVVPADAGSYRCSATNSCGTTQSDPGYLILCTGDLNADNLVDDSDFTLFVVQYNVLDCADPTMRPGCAADLNKDGIVDDSDFQQFIPAYDQVLCF